MKKLIILTLIIVAISNIFIFKLRISNLNLKALLNANVEALADASNPCYSGGIGAQSCSIDAGTEILGSGVSLGCSVSCYDGYFACCSIRCLCMLAMVPDTPEGM